MLKFVSLLVGAVLLVAPIARAADRLVIHEWGTFTSLQDENGRSLGGINGDVEALPPFVHDLISSTQNNNKGGIPRCFPSVTMRLETPVLYFHPAPGTTLPPIDVSVQFFGGWLSQFYPNAAALVPHFSVGTLDPITAQTVGTLAWKGVVIGGDQTGPATDSHVWTAPRAVDAANVRADSGEAEKFLFYRGVGHLDAPLSLVRQGNQIEAHSQIEFAIKHLLDLKIPAAWFCEIRDDGTCAWRATDALQLSPYDSKPIAVIAPFIEADFSAANLDSLKSAMRASLQQSGLFAKEAVAMLSTWEQSYFKSPGVRLFIIVPLDWTDHYLPLHVSVDADIQRVMIGRIDLVTPTQRETLQKLATMTSFEREKAWNTLGRFREALVMDQERRHPSEALKQWMGSLDIPLN